MRKCKLIFQLKERVGKFPIFKTNLVKWNKGENKIFRKFTVPSILLNPPPGYADYILKGIIKDFNLGYKFFLPLDFDDDEKEIGLYQNKYK